MYRSASWTKGSDDYFVHSPPKASTLLRMASRMEEDELPAYDPIVEMARKEKHHSKFAENAVHLIPVVLLICGFILWFFSNPDVEVGVTKVDSIASRIEGLTIEGDIDNDSDGTQTGFLPIEVEDPTKPSQANDSKNFRKFMKKFA